MADEKKPVEKKAVAKKPAEKKAAVKKAVKTVAAAKTAKKAAGKAVKTAAVAKAASTAAKKLGNIYFEFDGQQIDLKAIKKKAELLGGDVYVVIAEKKIYDTAGNSVDLI